jgi:hypothetical protein
MRIMNSKLKRNEFIRRAMPRVEQHYIGNSICHEILCGKDDVQTILDTVVVQVGYILWLEY